MDVCAVCGEAKELSEPSRAQLVCSQIVSVEARSLLGNSLQYVNHHMFWSVFSVISFPHIHQLCPIGIVGCGGQGAWDSWFHTAVGWS